jgi:hypothetical protein
MRVLTAVAIGTWLLFALWIGFAPGAASAQETSAAQPKTRDLPPDIRADSLSRMPRPKREDFTTEEDRQSFDRVVISEPSLKDKDGNLRATGTRAWIPQLAEEYRRLDGMVHTIDGLDRKYMELACLVAIRESNSPAEWGGHSANGTKLLGAKTVEVVRNEDDPSVLDDRKSAILIQFGRELIHQEKVSSKTFAEMEQAFGRRTTLHVTLLMGYYHQNAMLNRAFDQHVDAEKVANYPPW